MPPVFFTRWHHMIEDTMAHSLFAAQVARNSKLRLNQMCIIMHAGSEEDCYSFTFMYYRHPWHSQRRQHPYVYKSKCRNVTQVICNNIASIGPTSWQSERNKTARLKINKVFYFCKSITKCELEFNKHLITFPSSVKADSLLVKCVYSQLKCTASLQIHTRSGVLQDNSPYRLK